MSETSFSAMLRRLSKEYYQSHIGFEEYRAQRKSILDKIDEELNGRRSYDSLKGESNDSSHLMSTVAFFKNTDVDT